MSGLCWRSAGRSKKIQHPLSSSAPQSCPAAMLGGQVWRQWWQLLPGPGLLVSQPGASLGARAVVGMLPELLVLVTESLCALAASLAAPLAACGTSSTPALAAMPILLVVDVRAATALSRAVSSPRVVSSSNVAACKAATTVFLEFLASQMTSGNLASSLTSNWWNWTAT